MSCYVMSQELVEGGDLFHHLKEQPNKTLSEQRAAQEVLLPFLRALAHLHSKVGGVSGQLIQ